MPKILTIIFLLSITYNLHAQSWEMGGFAGGAGYMGDLNPTNPLKISGAAIGGLVKYNFNGYLSAKLNYTYGNISGADSTSSSQQARNRNLSFFTHLSELSVIGEFNFMKYIPSVSNNVYTPFIYVGIGIVGYNPQATYNGQTYDLRPLKTEGQTKPYPNTAISIPYGAGIKYNFYGSWNIIADIGYRNPNTNYLDDVSGVYPDKSKLSSPLSVALSDRSGEKTGTYIGAAGTQRGNLSNGDTYLFVGLTISYTFITSKCYY
jgi:hypothetical protein